MSKHTAGLQNILNDDALGVLSGSKRSTRRISEAADPAKNEVLNQ